MIERTAVPAIPDSEGSDGIRPEHGDATPVVSAIRSIVAGKTDVCVFSYRADFEKLWGYLADGGIADVVPELGGDATVVIVWDGMPDEEVADPIAVDRFVSPYDWAMVLSWAVYEDCRLKDLKLRILILDARGPDPEDGGFACRSLFYFQNAFPWIQDYRLAGDGDPDSGVLLGMGAEPRDVETYAWTRQAIPPEQRDAQVFVDDLLCPRRILTTHAKEDLDRTGSMRATRDLWIQNLLRAENRHSVADLVAPAILASELGVGRKILPSAGRQALVSALGSVGLVALPGSSQSGRKLCGLQNCGPFERRKGVRFVLVDDQYELGYKSVLERILLGKSGKGTATLECTRTLECILKRIRCFAPEAGCSMPWDMPRYFPKDRNGWDVLLLDLRMWSDDAARREMLQQIVGAATDVKATESSDPHLRAALKAAKRSVCAGAPESAEALALLPLLLSHIDPTLPIVIFSSTRQRVVAEMLQSRPNIITNFAKPLPSTYADTEMHSVEDLRRALNKALDLHEVRVAWRRLCEFPGAQNGGDLCFCGPEVLHPVSIAFAGDRGLSEELARMLRRLLFATNVHEMLDLPWEYLEKRARRVKRTSLILSVEGAHVTRNRGCLAEALKQIRIQKTHGRLDRNRFSGQKGRCLAVVQFLFLLDYLRGCRYSSTDEPANNGTVTIGRKQDYGLVLARLRQKARWYEEIGEWHSYLHPDTRKCLNGLA